jgi:formylmethanofuran dehydrogenase subunit E
MNKKVSYTKLSSIKCKKCGQYLKMNLVNKNPNAELCFKCHPDSRTNRVKSR